MTWLPPMRRASREATRSAVIRAVGDLVGGAPALRDRPGMRHRVSTDLVRFGMALAELLDADLALSERLSGASTLAAGDDLGMQATRAAGDTLRQLRDAVDFPHFVAGLITGVFRAIWQSNVEQMTAIADLLQAVGTSADAFAKSQVSDGEAAAYLTKAVPGLRVSDGGGRLAVQADASGALLSNPAALQKALGASEQDVAGLSPENLTERLVPLAKRSLGRTKQQTLATLVMMGLNRIVVDKGQLHASMDLRVDARSAADATSRSRLDSRTNVGMTAAGLGPGWGVAGSASSTVGVVKDDQSATSEEIAGRAAVRSSVDLVFHSQPIQLDAVATADLQKQIVANSTIPTASWSDGTILKDATRSTFDQLSAVPDAPAAPNLGDQLSALTNAGIKAPTSLVEGSKPAQDAPADTSAPADPGGTT